MYVKKLLKNMLYPLIKARPNCLIVGAQKAGTTSLFHYLAQHDEIRTNTNGYEIHFFDEPRNYAQGPAWYFGNFNNRWACRKKIVLERTPAYMVYPQIASLIFELLGEIKIIAILRDPAHRAYSAWRMYHSFRDNPHAHLRQQFDGRTFSQAIEDELQQRCANAGYPYHYLDRGRYVYQISRFQKTFGTNNVLVLEMGQLSNNLEALLAATTEFLNIAPFDQTVVKRLKAKQFNKGIDHVPTDEDLQTITALSTYYSSLNDELFELLKKKFEWGMSKN